MGSAGCPSVKMCPRPRGLGDVCRNEKSHQEGRKTTGFGGCVPFVRWQRGGEHSGVFSSPVSAPLEAPENESLPRIGPGHFQKSASVWDFQAGFISPPVFSNTATCSGIKGVRLIETLPLWLRVSELTDSVVALGRPVLHPSSRRRGYFTF